MPRGQLRSFAAGLDVPQRDPTTGQQRAKGPLLAALVAGLRPLRGMVSLLAIHRRIVGMFELCVDGLFISMVLRTFPT